MLRKIVHRQLCTVKCAQSICTVKCAQSICTVKCAQSIVHSQLCTVKCAQSICTVKCAQSIVHCQLCTVNCAQSIVHSQQNIKFLLQLVQSFVCACLIYIGKSIVSVCVLSFVVVSVFLCLLIPQILRWSRMIKFTLAGLTTPSQVIRIITIKITDVIILCRFSVFVPQLGVSSRRLRVEHKKALK